MSKTEYRYDDKTQNCWGAPSIKLDDISLKDLIRQLIDIHKEYEIKQGKEIIFGRPYKTSNNGLDMHAIQTLNFQEQIQKRIDNLDRSISRCNKYIYRIKNDELSNQKESLEKYKIKMQKRKIKGKLDPFMKAKYQKKLAKYNKNLGYIKKYRLQIIEYEKEIQLLENEYGIKCIKYTYR